VRIGVVGAGIIGSAFINGFQHYGYAVVVHSKDRQTKITDVVGADIIFICVPTPSIRGTGQCDCSVVDSVLTELDAIGYRGVIAIKSTVEIGFTAGAINRFPRLTICFVPEFLRERCALADLLEQKTVIIGVTSDKAADILAEVFQPFKAEIVRCGVSEAEAIKYFHNVYNALRITFANQMYDLLSLKGVNYQRVLDGFAEVNESTKDYLRCSPELRGFAGACLPKDTKALAYLAKEVGIEQNLFSVILELNDSVPQTVFEGMRSDV